MKTTPTSVKSGSRRSLGDGVSDGTVSLTVARRLRARRIEAPAEGRSGARDTDGGLGQDGDGVYDVSDELDGRGGGRGMGLVGNE
ncbi:hypothetical protein L484_011303 [Morus notabilis]|uniref:Uncharacterized protein n=1 Tax=Morus notabilis TaxID=981085 RepID=W9S079_9ROSA|nr:hypothetical protein L484_011303 [Morus notabilis]